MHIEIPSLSAAKQTGETLEASHQTLETLLECVPAAIVVSDEGGRIVRVNAYVEKLFGYSREELLGQTIEILVPERFRGLYMEHRRQYLQDPKRRAMGTGIELYGRHKNGKEFILSLIQDFAERDAAATFRLHLTALVNSSSEAIIGRTLDGIVCSWNQSAERDELWSLPPGSKAETTLEAVFDSLESALSQRLLAFGRGGFCILATRRLTEGPIDLLLDFQAERRRVEGHGVVRWTAMPEPEVGVEIMYIHDENRAWILSQTGPNESLSFIPKTTTAAAIPASVNEV